MSDTIKIRISDLNDPDKVEKFIQLFGHSNYYKARQELSKQIHGDGMKERIENQMGSMNLDNPEELEAYENLRAKWEKESDRLKKPKNAVYEVNVGHHGIDSVFNNRDMAKEYLGITRYYKAVGLDDKQSVSPDGSDLRRDNPFIREVEQKNNDLQDRINELEQKRQALLNEKKGLKE